MEPSVSHFLSFCCSVHFAALVLLSCLLLYTDSFFAATCILSLVCFATSSWKWKHSLLVTCFLLLQCSFCCLNCSCIWIHFCCYMYSTSCSSHLFRYFPMENGGTLCDMTCFLFAAVFVLFYYFLLLYLLLLYMHPFSLPGMLLCV